MVVEEVVDFADDVLESMSAEELEAYERGELDKLTAGNADEPASDEGEPESANADEQEEKTQEEEPDEDEQEPDKAEVASEESGKAEQASGDSFEAKYKALQGIVEKIQRDKTEADAKLSGYQKLDADYQRVQTMVNDPRFAKFFVDNALGAGQPNVAPTIYGVPQDFDYTNPQNVAQVASKAAQAQLAQFIKNAQMNATRQKEIDYVNTVQAKKAALVAQHAIDPNTLEAHIRELNKLVSEGNVAEIAYKVATYEQRIADAKKEAIAETQKKIVDAGNRPKRATGASVGKQTFAESKTIDQMSVDELIAEADKIATKDPGNPKLDKIMKRIESLGV